MNILPKKDWHVWRRENVVKVEEDEKKFRDQQDAAKKRKREVDQERRWDLLKHRRGMHHEEMDRKGPRISSEGRTTAGEEHTAKHINLFEDWERKVKAHGERVKGDKKEPLNTAPLALGSVETMKSKPWWFSSSIAPAVDAKKAARRAADRERADPITLLRTVLPSHEFLPGDADIEPQQPLKSSKKDKKSKKHHRKKRNKDSYDLEFLRRERLEREAEERKRRRDESGERDGYSMQYRDWARGKR